MELILQYLEMENQGTNNESMIQSVNNSVNQTKSHLPVIAMAMFVLVAFSALAFLYYQNQQLKQMLASYQAPTFTPIPTPTSDPTANWKTYIDQKKLYSFKYPSDLIPKIKTNGIISFTDSNDKTLFNLSGFKILTSNEYLKYIKQNYLSDSKTFVDSQKRTWQTYMVLGEVFNFTGILDIENKFYIIDFQNNFENSEDNFKFLISQILSTFKFVEASPSSSPRPSLLPVGY